MIPSRKQSKPQRQKRVRNVGLLAGGLAGTLLLGAGIMLMLPGQPEKAGTSADAAARTASPTPAPSSAETPAAPSPSAAVSPAATASPSPSPSLRPSGAENAAAASTPAPAPSVKPTATPAAGGAETAGPDPANDPHSVKLSFVGDVIMASAVETLLKQHGYDYPYTEVKADLERADLAIANLETPISLRGAPQSKEYTYRSSPLALPPFKEAGFDLVNLANNHILDYGQDALLDTFDNLKKNGIPYVGAGHNSQEAFEPVILDKKGMRIAFLGFSRVVPDNSWKAGPNHPGVADTYNYTVPVESIRKAREKADLVVVIAHWGVERQSQAEAYQRDLAHRYIEAGADLIIGGHPHVLQGFEKYKGKWIAYSLGNFIFTTNTVKETLDSMILEASCSKDRQCSLKALPIFTQWAKPVPMQPADAAKLFDRLSKVSYGSRILPDGRITAEP